jgi:choline dehydrogenase-like flavoprotein
MFGIRDGSPARHQASISLRQGARRQLLDQFYLRGQIRDYAAWQDEVGDTGKWSYEDLLPVFMAQEDNDTFHDEYHGIEGGLAVQLPKGINKLNQLPQETGELVPQPQRPRTRRHRVGR